MVSLRRQSDDSQDCGDHSRAILPDAQPGAGFLERRFTGGTAAHSHQLLLAEISGVGAFLASAAPSPTVARELWPSHFRHSQGSEFFGATN